MYRLYTNLDGKAVEQSQGDILVFLLSAILILKMLRLVLGNRKLEHNHVQNRRQRLFANPRRTTGRDNLR